MKTWDKEHDGLVELPYSNRYSGSKLWPWHRGWCSMGLGEACRGGV